MGFCHDDTLGFHFPPFRAIPMLLRLLILFITVPLVELYLLLQLANLTGARCDIPLSHHYRSYRLLACQT